MSSGIQIVARKAGVSTAAVSRILRGDTTMRVSSDTRERILSAARDLDYIPDARARQLGGRTSPLLGVLIHGLWGTYRSAFLHHLTEGLTPMGKEAILGIHHGDPKLVKHFIRTFRAYRTFAVLVIGNQEGVDNDVVRMFDECRNECGPRIAVAFLDVPPGATTVRVDVPWVHRQFLNMLVGERIPRAVLATRATRGTEYIAPVFKSTLQAVPDVKGDVLAIDTEDSDEFARQAVPEIKRHARAGRVGVITGIDNEAVVLADGLIRAGLRVPEDVAFVGYGNFEVSRLHHPSISTFDVLGTIPAMAEKALELLAGLKGSKTISPGEFCFHPTFIPRESFHPRCATLPAGAGAGSNRKAVRKEVD